MLEKYKLRIGQNAYDPLFKLFQRILLPVALIAYPAHRMTEFRIGKKTPNPLGQDLNIAGSHQESIFSFHHQIRNRSNRRRHDREPGTHRFRGNQTECFPIGREYEDIGTGKESGFIWAISGTMIQDSIL